jgi:class 3 adenylate cyclase
VSAWVTLAPGTAGERTVAVGGRLVVGRAPAGVEAAQRLVVEDPAVSREHLELRVDAAGGVVLIDTSTNGTRVNGRRVERGEPIALRDGDAIELGAARLAFRAPRLPDAVVDAVRATLRTPSAVRLALVAGDIVGYTALTEQHGGDAVAVATDALFGELRELVHAHGGTVAGYNGDAILAGWEAEGDAGAAVAFAVAAAALVPRRAEALALRAADGTPLRMGWGVTLGAASSARPSPASEALHGDAVNLAFRLSGLAARDGHAPVLVAEEAVRAAPDAAGYGPLLELVVRGRQAPAAVRAASG